MKDINEMTIAEFEIENRKEIRKIMFAAAAARTTVKIAKWGLITIGVVAAYGMLKNGKTETQVES